MVACFVSTGSIFFCEACRIFLTTISLKFGAERSAPRLKKGPRESRDFREAIQETINVSPPTRLPHRRRRIEPVAPRILHRAGFAAVKRARQAFADHDVGDISAFHLQHTAIAAVVAGAVTLLP